MLIAGGNVLGAAIQESKLLDMVAGVLERGRFNMLIMRRKGGSHRVLHCLWLLAGMLDCYLSYHAERTAEHTRIGIHEDKFDEMPFFAWQRPLVRS
jgi:hypothetical protein